MSLVIQLTTPLITSHGTNVSSDHDLDAKDFVQPVRRSWELVSDPVLSSPRAPHCQSHSLSEAPAACLDMHRAKSRIRMQRSYSCVTVGAVCDLPRIKAVSTGNVAT